MNIFQHVVLPGHAQRRPPARALASFSRAAMTEDERRAQSRWREHLGDLFHHVHIRLDGRAAHDDKWPGPGWQETERPQRVRRCSHGPKRRGWGSLDVYIPLSVSVAAVRMLASTVKLRAMRVGALPFYVLVELGGGIFGVMIGRRRCKAVGERFRVS